jgi:predicted methyltransferase
VGKNKAYRKQLEGHQKALLEHLNKITKEREKPVEFQDQGLIAHWEKTVANCQQQIAKLERRLES